MHTSLGPQDVFQTQPLGVRRIGPPGVHGSAPSGHPGLRRAGPLGTSMSGTCATVSDPSMRAVTFSPTKVGNAVVASLGRSWVKSPWILQLSTSANCLGSFRHVKLRSSAKLITSAWWTPDVSACTLV
ncbi:hypothetical protein GQ457_03G019220 [Hibiscus cannabinus]